MTWGLGVGLRAEEAASVRVGQICDLRLRAELRAVSAPIVSMVRHLEGLIPENRHRSTWDP